MRSAYIKWKTDKHTIGSEFLEKIHKICFSSIKDNYLIWFQYKNTCRIMGPKNFLHKIKLSTLPSRDLCHKNEETLYLFYVKRALIFGEISKYVSNKCRKS